MATLIKAQASEQTYSGLVSPQSIINMNTNCLSSSNTCSAHTGTPTQLQDLRGARRSRRQVAESALADSTSVALLTSSQAAAAAADVVGLESMPEAAAQQAAPGSSSSGNQADRQQPASGSSDSLSLASQQQAAAYALAQEANRAASKLNAELCRNFSIGIQHENGGIFTSPNYPNPYPTNLICTRLIEGEFSLFS